MDQEVKMQEAKGKSVTKQETAEQMIKDHGVPDQDAGMVFQDAAIDEDILRAVLSMGNHVSNSGKGDPGNVGGEGYYRAGTDWNR